MTIENKIKDCKRHQGWSNNDGAEITDLTVCAALDFNNRCKHLNLTVEDLYPTIDGGISFFLGNCHVVVYATDNVTLFVDENITNEKASYHKSNLSFDKVIKLIEKLN